MEAVLRATWERTPLWVRFFINEKALKKILQEWYLSGKDQMKI